MNNKDLLKLGVINFIIVILGSYVAIELYMSQFSLPLKCNVKPQMTSPMDLNHPQQIPMHLPMNMPNGPQSPVQEPSQR